MNIGLKIQELRMKHGLSQEALAERLGVSRQSVSKWELGQATPDVDKIIGMSRLFRVAADDILLVHGNSFLKPNRNQLHLGSVYLIVKNFQKSIDFYEKLLSMRVSTINPGVFAEFYFDNKNISVMSETNLPGHNTDGSGDHKFVLNFWIEQLQPEYDRVRSLRIGTVAEIERAHTDYWFFHVFDPDNNVIEITGGYEGGETMKDSHCQSCFMPMKKKKEFGREADGSQSRDYCCHCYKNGDFSWKPTFEEFVEANLPFWRDGCKDDDEARAQMMEIFSKLKRWKA